MWIQCPSNQKLERGLDPCVKRGEVSEVGIVKEDEMTHPENPDPQWFLEVWLTPWVLSTVIFLCFVHWLPELLVGTFPGLQTTQPREGRKAVSGQVLGLQINCLSPPAPTRPLHPRGVNRTMHKRGQKMSSFLRDMKCVTYALPGNAIRN